MFLLPERSALAKLSYAPNFPCGSYVFLQVGGGWSTPTEGLATGDRTTPIWLVGRALRADQRHEAAGRQSLGLQAAADFMIGLEHLARRPANRDHEDAAFD